MEQNKIDNCVYLLNNVDYIDKKAIYTSVFTFGELDSKNVNDKLILISLLSLVYIKSKEKNPTITPIEILCKILGKQKDDGDFYRFLEALSIIVEDFAHGCTTADNCGLKTTVEIINKIKEILNTWMPF